MGGKPTSFSSGRATSLCGGARLIAAADRFEMVPGMSYRKAAGFAADEARHPLEPSIDEVLPPTAQYRYR